MGTSKLVVMISIKSCSVSHIVQGELVGFLQHAIYTYRFLPLLYSHSQNLPKRERRAWKIGRSVHCRTFRILSTFCHQQIFLPNQTHLQSVVTVIFYLFRTFSKAMKQNMAPSKDKSYAISASNKQCQSKPITSSCILGAVYTSTAVHQLDLPF